MSVQEELQNNYILNEQTLNFINYLGEKTPENTVYTTNELIDLFQQSNFYNQVVTSYYESAVSKAISYAVTRSSYWTRIKRGINKRKCSTNAEPKSANNNNNINLSKITVDAHSINRVTDSPARKELIEFLASNMFDVLMIKKNIKDDGLRQYHFKRGIGEDLYFLTESFYKQKNLSGFKHYISDFITEDAEAIIRSGQKNNLIYEHMVPKNLYLSKISSEALKGTLTEEMVYELFNRYLYVCTISKNSENNMLPRTSMGLNWNKEDPFFRYKSTGIKFYPNIFNKLYFS